MADVNTQSCDFCSTLKGSGNHWFRLFLPDRNRPVAEAEAIITPWENVAPREAKQLHACGVECLTKLLYKFVFADGEHDPPQK